MAPNRGHVLEHQFIASLPAGRVWVQKLNTPLPQAGRLFAYLKQVNRGHLPEWMAGMMRSSFTPTQPFDLLVVAPVVSAPGQPLTMFLKSPAGGHFELRIRHTLSFAFELKCCGEERSLPFNRVKPHQLDGLLDAAARGLVAGLLIEFPEVGPDGSLFFVPAALFAAYQAGADRASFPLVAAEEHGILIEPDVERGRVHRYWKAAEFLSRFGADLPPTPAPRRSRAAATETL